MFIRKIQKFILKTFCNYYYGEMFKLLCEKENQIKNLSTQNKYLRQRIQELNIYLKGN